MMLVGKYFVRYEGQIPRLPTARRNAIYLAVGGQSIRLFWSAINRRRPRVVIHWFHGGLIDMFSLRVVTVIPYYYKQAMEQIINIVLLQIDVPPDWKPDLRPSNHRK
jgi:hypothetical protein